MNRGATLRKAQTAKTKALRVFRDLVGHASVGVVPFGDHRYGLKVNIETVPDEGVSLPNNVDGVPVRIEVVGTTHKL